MTNGKVKMSFLDVIHETFRDGEKSKIEGNKKKLKAKMRLINQELSDLAQRKRMAEVERKFLWILRKGLPFDIHTCSIVMNAYSRCQEIEKMEDLIEFMSKLDSKRFSANEVTLTTVLKGYCESGNILRAFEILDNNFSKLNIEPNIRALSTFLRGCIKCGNLDLVRKIDTKFDVVNSLWSKIEQRSDIIGAMSYFENYVQLLCQMQSIEESLAVTEKVLHLFENMSTEDQKLCFVCVLSMCRSIAFCTSLIGNFSVAMTYVSRARDLFNKFSKYRHMDTDNDNDNVSLVSRKRKLGDLKNDVPDSASLFVQHRESEYMREINLIEEFVNNSFAYYDNIVQNSSPFSQYLHQLSDSPGSVQINLIFIELIQKLKFLVTLSHVFYFGYYFDSIDKLAAEQDSFVVHGMEFSISSWTERYGLANILISLSQPLPFEHKYLNKLRTLIHQIGKEDLPLSARNLWNEEHKKFSIQSTFSRSIWDIILPKLLSLIERWKKKEKDSSVKALVTDFYNSLQLLSSKRLDTVKDNEIVVELGAGDGDWVMHQASVPSNSANWMAFELRCDRIYHIFGRCLLNGIPSQEYSCLYMLPVGFFGGNAISIFHHLVDTNSIAHVFSNFPEPPERNSNSEICQGKHLLTLDFLLDCKRVLQEHGKLTILSDNLLYLTSIGAELSHYAQQEMNNLLKHNKTSVSILVDVINSLPKSRNGKTRMMQQIFPIHNNNVGNNEKKEESSPSSSVIVPSTSSLAVVGAIRIWKGEPNEEEGHFLGGSSYFDRLWSNGQRIGRWYLHVSKTTYNDDMQLQSS